LLIKRFATIIARKNSRKKSYRKAK
jgi:hypothetical protein